MERTVPYTASEEVELYQRTYYSLLRTSDTVQIRSIEEVHAGMNSLLHQHARHQEPDMMAFIYALLRLPECIRDTKEIVLGQTGTVFEEAGLGNVWIGSRSMEKHAAAVVFTITTKISWLASSPAAQILMMSSPCLQPIRSNGIRSINCCNFCPMISI